MHLDEASVNDLKTACLNSKTLDHELIFTDAFNFDILKAFNQIIFNVNEIYAQGIKDVANFVTFLDWYRGLLSYVYTNNKPLVILDTPYDNFLFRKISDKKIDKLFIDNGKKLLSRSTFANLCGEANLDRKEMFVHLVRYFTAKANVHPLKVLHYGLVTPAIEVS